MDNAWSLKLYPTESVFHPPQRASQSGHNMNLERDQVPYIVRLTFIERIRHLLAFFD